jgi:nucleotide-binding universal stress UspA family protein
MSPYPEGPILFCFDGSDGSRHAMNAAASLLAPRDVVVLTVWESIATRLATGGLLPVAGVSYISDEGDLDAQEEAAAQQAAEQGAKAATERGWSATPRASNAQLAAWRTIVDTADEIDAALIVCGARGLNLAKRAIIGSVSEAVLHHSHRPTLIAAQPREDD